MIPARGSNDIFLIISTFIPFLVEVTLSCFSDAAKSGGGLLFFSIRRRSARFSFPLFRLRFLRLYWSRFGFCGFGLYMSFLGCLFRLLFLCPRFSFSVPSSFCGGADFRPRRGRERAALLWSRHSYGGGFGRPIDHRRQFYAYLPQIRNLRVEVFEGKAKQFRQIISPCGGHRSKLR